MTWESTNPWPCLPTRPPRQGRGHALVIDSGWREVAETALAFGQRFAWTERALWGFVRPVNTFFALASVLGLVLVFYGSFEIIRGVASRPVNPYWWLQLITGILLILLAFWVSGSDRVYALAQRTYLILFWVGFLALFRGFSQIFLAFAVRHEGQGAAALGDIPGSR